MLATEAPRNRTPQNSNMDAISTACFRVIDLDATDVAYYRLWYIDVCVCVCLCVEM